MAWTRETLTTAAGGFVSALGGVGRVPAPFGVALPGATLAGALLGAALAVLLAGGARSDEGVRDALLFVAIALGLALAVSLWRPVAFAGRAEMAVLPVWMWAVARAAGRRRSVAVAAGLASAAGLATTLAVAFGPHPRSTAFSATTSVTRLAHPGDTLLAGPGFYLPALVESARGRLAARVLALPESDRTHPGWFVPAGAGPAEERELARTMDALPENRRLFLLHPALVSDAGGDADSVRSRHRARDRPSDGRGAARLERLGDSVVVAPRLESGANLEQQPDKAPSQAAAAGDGERRLHEPRLRHHEERAERREDAVTRRGIEAAERDRPDEILRRRTRALRRARRARAAGTPA